MSVLSHGKGKICSNFYKTHVQPPPPPTPLTTTNQLNISHWIHLPLACSHDDDDNYKDVGAVICLSICLSVFLRVYLCVCVWRGKFFLNLRHLLQISIDLPLVPFRLTWSIHPSIYLSICQSEGWWLEPLSLTASICAHRWLRCTLTSAPPPIAAAAAATATASTTALAIQMMTVEQALAGEREIHSHLESRFELTNSLTLTPSSCII